MPIAAVLLFVLLSFEVDVEIRLVPPWNADVRQKAGSELLAESGMKEK